MSKHGINRRGRLWGQRILSVIGGFLAVVILSTVTDIVLEQIGVLPPPDRGLFDTGLLLLALAYRSLYTIAGGYITSRLAPDRPIRHAVALGLLGLVAGSLGAVVNAEQSPGWYPWGLVALALPLTWLGGKLAGLRSAFQSPAVTDEPLSERVATPE